MKKQIPSKKAEKTMLNDSFLHVKSQIEKTRQSAVGSAEMVHLIAVSKQQPDEKIDAALATGHRLFGETVFKKQQRGGRIVVLYFPICAYI